MTASEASRIFEACVQAIRDGEWIEREGERDKEFHFQNWFARRLDALGLHYAKTGGVLF